MILLVRLAGLPLLAGAVLYLLQWLLTARRRWLAVPLPVLALAALIAAVCLGWRNNPEGFGVLVFDGQKLLTR